MSNLHDEELCVLWAEAENQKSPESPSFPSRHIYTASPDRVPRPVQRAVRLHADSFHTLVFIQVKVTCPFRSAFERMNTCEDAYTHLF